MFDTFPFPPNFTLGPPPKPPWINYDFSCTDGEVLLHVDFSGISTAPSNEEFSNEVQSNSNTVSILGALIGLLALILSSLVVFLYIYKKKILKDEVHHNEPYVSQKFEPNKFYSLEESPEETASSPMNREASKMCNDAQPYCNVYIPKPRDNFDGDNPCYTTIGRASTATSCVSSESREFTYIPVKEKKLQLKMPDICPAPQVERQIVTFDRHGLEIADRFASLQAQPCRVNSEGRRRRRRRARSYSRPSNNNAGVTAAPHTPTYGTMDSCSGHLYKAALAQVNRMDVLAGSFSSRISLPYENEVNTPAATAREDFRSSALTVAPYRQSRRGPRMGVGSLRSSSLGSCVWEPDD